MDIHQDTAADLEGYQLFRQAIVEGDAEAWATIADRYRRQMVAWANHCCARLPIHKPPSDIADQALVRAWAARSAALFESFPNLAAFLAYLRSCVMATAIDYTREQNARMRNEQLAQIETGAISLEQAMLGKQQRDELWCLIESTTKSAQEQLLAHASLIDALPARTIYTRHPDQFDSVAAIYRMKRNLFKRLQHNHAIERLRNEGTLAHNGDT